MVLWLLSICWELAGMAQEGPLKVVLFGLPSAGKSALLGALVQAAQAQGGTLRARLVDAPVDLTELRAKVTENRLQPNQDEVTPHTLTLEPLAGGEPLVTEVTDSSGRAAGEMINGQRPLEGRKSGSLGKAMREADALIVAADAAAEPAQIQRDFGQLAPFLRLFEQSRARRTDVAGLPVYLALTKCDLLAKKNDTAASWLERIQERKKQIEQGLRKYLAPADGQAGAFGTVDLRAWATAIQQPAIADRPANPHEPYGVAELFRQSFESARRFRAHSDQADRRLQVTLSGVAGLLAIMLLVGMAVYASRPSPEVAALENALRDVLPGPEATPADRLREPLDKKLDRLRKIEKDPNYSLLPSSKREEVTQYVKEVQAYLKFNKDFLDKVPDPRFATSGEELSAIDKRLAETELPPEYRAAWNDTRVGRRAAQWHREIDILRQEVAAAEAWIKEQIRKGRELEEEGLGLRKASAEAKKAWLERSRQYLDQEWPHPPGSHPQGAAGLTYETVYHFDRVDRVRQVWDEFKEKRLGYVRQLLEEKS